MHPKDEPEGFKKAVAKQWITKELLMAMAALQTAQSRLDILDHEPGCLQLAGYQDGIKRLIVEVSQL